MNTCALVIFSQDYQSIIFTILLISECQPSLSQIYSMILIPGTQNYDFSPDIVNLARSISVRVLFSDYICSRTYLQTPDIIFSLSYVYFRPFTLMLFRKG